MLLVRMIIVLPRRRLKINCWIYRFIHHYAPHYCMEKNTETNRINNRSGERVRFQELLLVTPLDNVSICYLWVDGLHVVRFLNINMLVLYEYSLHSCTLDPYQHANTHFRNILQKHTCNTLETRYALTQCWSQAWSDQLSILVPKLHLCYSRGMEAVLMLGCVVKKEENCEFIGCVLRLTFHHAKCAHELATVGTFRKWSASFPIRRKYQLELHVKQVDQNCVEFISYFQFFFYRNSKRTWFLPDVFCLCAVTTNTEALYTLNLTITSDQPCPKPLI